VPHIKVVRIDEALTFVNCDYIKEQMLKLAQGLEREEGTTPPVTPPPGTTTTTTTTTMSPQVNKSSSSTTTTIASPSSEGGQEEGDDHLNNNNRDKAHRNKLLTVIPFHLPSSPSSTTPAKGKGKDGGMMVMERFIVLDSSSMNWTDLSGIKALSDISDDLKKHRLV